MDKSENGTLIAKVICLLLSFGLWLYVSNVENPSRTYDLKNVPVELTNENYIANSKLAIAKDEQFTVDLKLEGPSSEVMKVKKEDFKIIADMSAYALRNGENSIPVQIVSCPENISIKNSGFLGIKINLEELVQKEFTIKSKVKINYKENIYEKQQTISPQTVKVTGGKSSIERISDAVLTGEEKGIDKNTQSDYSIRLVDSSGNEVNNVETDNKTAKLSIEVTNGKGVPITLKTTGVMPQGFVLDGYELSRNNVNILGDSMSLDKISSVDTEPVDMSSLQSDREMNVKLNLPEGISVPDGEGIINVKFKVKKVENIIKNLVCNVRVSNLNEAFLLENSDLTANVTLAGTKTDLDNISSQNIDVVLDLSDVKQEGNYNYKPKVALANGSNVTISDVGNINIVVKKKT